MAATFEVKQGLLRGITAYLWFWLALYSFIAALAASIIGFATIGIVPQAVSVVGSVVPIAGLIVLGVSWAMMFLQKARELKAGYTTLWTDEDERHVDEVDPSTGLIIRLAGNDPLSKPERRAARAEARSRARQLIASGAPYELPFGWHKPSPR